MQKNETITETKTVGDIEFNKLSIPIYQRPYRWGTKNVGQLLDDMRDFLKKGNYRLGTLVLHESNDKLEIVDGQQRIVTLALLLIAMGREKTVSSFVNNRFSSKESISNIKQNFDYIKRNSAGIDINKVCNQCEFVVIKLSDIREAFQFFDSQNSRGKELEPYDLLKAYHLREIRELTQYDRLNIRFWENIDNNTPEWEEKRLKKVFQILFRIKIWEACRSGSWAFERQHIDYFKSVSKCSTYPCDMQAKILYNIWQLGLKEFPFQIQAPIVDGSLFFDMIKHYSAIYEKIKKGQFGDEKLQLTPEWKVLYNGYIGNWRVGDQYIRALIDAALVLYTDKFGEADIDIVFRKIFRCAFLIRLQKDRIWWEAIENYACNPNELLQVIMKTKRHRTVTKFPVREVTEWKNLPLDSNWIEIMNNWNI